MAGANGMSTKGGPSKAKATIAGSNLNVVRLSRGDDRVQFEISKGGKAAWMKNSKGEGMAVGRTAARQRVARLTADGWKVSGSKAKSSAPKAKRGRRAMRDEMKAFRAQMA